MNETKIELRGMEPRDIKQVCILEAALFSDAWSEKSLEDTLKFHPDTSFAAVQEDCVQGYLLFMPAADEGELLRIGVDPAFRRQGTGRALMVCMDTYAISHGIETIWLEVRESNQPARSLYEQSGFTVQGLRKNYYKDPKEHAVIMSKKYARSFH